MLEPAAAFFCDEVRQEINGKYIIIGAYTGQIVVTAFPWSGRLQPVIMLTGDPSELRKLHFVLGTERGATFAEAEFELADMQFPGQEPLFSVFPLIAVGVSVSGPERLELRVSINGGELKKVGAVSVVAGEVASPSGG